MATAEGGRRLVAVGAPVWGYFVIGAGLVMWVVESLTIAVDQWFGHLADPSSPVASATIAPVLVRLAVIGMLPVLLFFRRRG